MTRSDAGRARGCHSQRTDAALELLDRQLVAYQELEALARRQPDLIAADDGDGLLALLAERQVVIERLTELNHQLGPVRAVWHELTPALSEAQRTRCRQTLDEIAALAEAIADRDSADRSALERRRAEVASELSSLSAGRGAVAAYRPSQPRPPRYQDREA